jgi:hypothetical protein
VHALVIRSTPKCRMTELAKQRGSPEFGDGRGTRRCRMQSASPGTQGPLGRLDPRRLQDRSLLPDLKDPRTMRSRGDRGGAGPPGSRGQIGPKAHRSNWMPKDQRCPAGDGANPDHRPRPTARASRSGRPASPRRPRPRGNVPCRHREGSLRCRDDELLVSFVCASVRGTVPRARRPRRP